MVNSLFMLGSSYNKKRKISVVFMIGWIAYMIIQSDDSLGVTFPLVNAMIFLGLSIMINLIKNRKINTVLSISSILIWSILIDTICYFMYPIPNSTTNIFGYIFQGILFNYRYIFTNIIAVCIIHIFDSVINKITILVKEKAIA